MRRHAKNATIASVSLFGAVAVWGCRDVVGIEDGPPTALAECAASYGEASSGCTQCMKASCCAEAIRCSGDSNCAKFAACSAKCAAGDLECSSRCRVPDPVTYGEAAAALDSCKAARCTSACSVSCGGYAYADPKCAECGIAKCCPAASACMGNAECAVLAACERACDTFDSKCLQRCELAHPDGVVLQRAFGKCLSESCADKCIPPRWSCLVNRKDSSPPATGPAISVRYRLIAYTGVDSGERVPGLSVTACGRTNAACNPPSAGPVVTGANGEAVLDLKVNYFDGYSEITGPNRTRAIVYLPTLTKSFVAILPSFDTPTFAFLGMGLTNAPLNPNLANILVDVVDCAGGPAGGVELSIDDDDGSTRFYVTSDGPTTAPRATQADPVFGAFGGFLNVKPGRVTVRAKVVDSGLQYDDVTVNARAGADTYTLVVLYAKPP